MKCHYEILGIARDADDASIKTAYRKMALQWHPDKNPNNLVEAKERFQFIQQAYETLSEPHERAWYDSHREQILRGAQTNYVDSSVNVFQYFTVSCYKGFGHDSKSFYAIYCDVFHQIAKEDIEFMESQNELNEIPTFGNPDSDYDNVVSKFYGYWLAYSTKKTYSWLCKYNLNEVRGDRRILREIEKEMKKITATARRERNEEVRQLVAFVKKRDPRVKARIKLLEEKAEQNRQKQNEKRLEQLRKNQLEVEEMAKNQDKSFFSIEGHEARLRQMEEAYASDEDSYFEDVDDENDEDLANGTENISLEEAEEEEEYIDHLYCVACNKSFKNESSYANHESSKKHRLNIEKIKQEMLNEENDTDDESIITEDQIDEDLLLSDSCEDNPLLKENIVDSADSCTDGELIAATNKKKKSKKSKRKAKQLINLSDDNTEEPTLENEITDDVPNSPLENSNDLLNDGTKDASVGKIKKQKKSKKKSKVDLDDAESEVELANDHSDDDRKGRKPKKSKGKKGAEPQILLKDVANADLNHTCVTCKAVFDSKNKLFQHLKKLNHGVYLGQLKVAAESVATEHVGGGSSKRGKKK